jgi:NADH-quinone oxidoreductase subunit L
VLLLTAGMTAFYSFRLVALIFHGEERYKLFGVHPHEAYRYMLIAMSPLALLAVVAGFLKMSYFDMVTAVLPLTEYHVHSAVTYWIMTIGTQLFVIAAILYAYRKYEVAKEDKKMEQNFFYKLLRNQYYIPQFYEEYLVKPYNELSRIFWKDIDMKIVDATVDLVATTFYKTGESTRGMQSGNLSVMLRWMVAGVMILLTLAAVYSITTMLVAG